jgi:hypothetical protein
MNRWIPIAALAVSAAALALSMHLYFTADARAEAAVERREQAMVERLRPGVVRVLGDFNQANDAQNAKTIDGLLEPLFRMATSIR